MMETTNFKHVPKERSAIKHTLNSFCCAVLEQVEVANIIKLGLLYCSGETEDTFIADLSVGLATVIVLLVFID